MASDEKKILLVEDEKAIRDVVAAYLDHENYIVRGVGDGQSAVEEFEKHSFDLVILDLMLPKLSGERVCRAIRETSNVPIIMLTAKGEVGRVIGLELGADDYLIRPFRRESSSQARARAARRAPRTEPQLEVLDFGDLVIDISGHKVWSRQGGRPHGLRVRSSPRLHAIPVASTPTWSWSRRSWLRLRRATSAPSTPRQEPARQAGRRSTQSALALHRSRRGLSLRGSPG